MSEFSDNIASAWGTSVTVFGDTCVIGVDTFNCVIHKLDYSDGVVGGKPGRTAAVGGQVLMRLVDWNTAGGKKGTQIIFPFGTYRVANDPIVGPTSQEVLLNISPLT